MASIPLGGSSALLLVTYPGSNRKHILDKGRSLYVAHAQAWMMLSTEKGLEGGSR